MQADIGNEDSDFVYWVSELIELQPPPELEAFYKARTAQFLLQTEVVDGQAEVSGPNDDTQWWYEREIGLVSSMPKHLVQALVDGGCLQDEDVEHGQRLMAAVSRMGEDGFFHPDTVEEYLQSCADIKLTMPVMNSMDANVEYMIIRWDRLEPPDTLEGYHAAVMRFYQAWQEAGDIDRVETSIVQGVNDEALKLDSDVVGSLISSGCAG